MGYVEVWGSPKGTFCPQAHTGTHNRSYKSNGYRFCWEAEVGLEIPVKLQCHWLVKFLKSNLTANGPVALDTRLSLVFTVIQKFQNPDITLKVWTTRFIHFNYQKCDPIRLPYKGNVCGRKWLECKNFGEISLLKYMSVFIVQFSLSLVYLFFKAEIELVYFSQNQLFYQMHLSSLSRYHPRLYWRGFEPCAVFSSDHSILHNPLPGGLCTSQIKEI